MIQNNYDIGNISNKNKYFFVFLSAYIIFDVNNKNYGNNNKCKSDYQRYRRVRLFRQIEYSFPPCQYVKKDRYSTTTTKTNRFKRLRERVMAKYRY